MAVNEPHIASINNGTYKENIGTTTFDLFCNDGEGFSVYAVGYSNEEKGNTNLFATVGGTLSPTFNISTGVATSGDVSNWAMKLVPVDGPNQPTILSDTDGSYANYHVIPTEYTKIATVTPSANSMYNSVFKTTYRAYISPEQPAGNYVGKVRYILVHPNDAINPGKTAYLDTGSNINSKFNSNGGCYYLRKGSALSTNFVPSESNTISLPGSPVPVYVEQIGNMGECNIVSDAEIIYMNKNSHYLFSDESSGAEYNRTIYENVMSNWDSSQIEDMSRMFFSGVKIDASNLINLDTSNVTNMSRMFAYEEGGGYTSIINGNSNTFANWDVSRVTDMSFMLNSWNGNGLFSSGYGYGPPNMINGLANWNVSNVTNMYGMFMGSDIPNLTSLASWNVGNVIYMSSLFQGTDISDLTPLANWNVGNVTTLSQMFERTKVSNLTPLANWDVSNVTNMHRMFWSITPTPINAQPINGWNVNKVTDFREMFYNRTPANNLPIFTLRPGTWNSSGTYIPNP